MEGQRLLQSKLLRLNQSSASLSPEILGFVSCIFHYFPFFSVFCCCCLVRLCYKNNKNVNGIKTVFLGGKHGRGWNRHLYNIYHLLQICIFFQLFFCQITKLQCNNKKYKTEKEQLPSSYSNKQQLFYRECFSKYRCTTLYCCTTVYFLLLFQSICCRIKVKSHYKTSLAY